MTYPRECDQCAAEVLTDNDEVDAFFCSPECRETYKADMQAMYAALQVVTR